MILFCSSIDAEEQASLRITDASPHYLTIEGGERISLSDLIWIQHGEHWRGSIGREVTRHKKRLEGKNRYGDSFEVFETGSWGWLQEYWVKKGFAVYSGRSPYPEDRKSVLLSAEQKARSQRRRGWQHFRILNGGEKAAFFGKSGFQIVEGLVRSTGKSKKYMYLNFGHDWRTDFTAAIPRENMRIFKKKGWKLEDFDHKWIRVRGYIRTYNGPFMDIYYPDQVEILANRSD
ncbi:MAG: hypothetical protein MI743_08565 [Sneathiellales bacterium]|nr:hypothetical protein [Sneathiellales bacterium]